MSDIIYELDNISEYILDITQNKLIIKKNLIELTENNYKSFNYTKSTILECKINNKDVSKLNFSPIVCELWKYLKTINIDFRNHTKINYANIKINSDYTFINNLNVYMQRQNSKTAFFEIFNLVKTLDIKFYIKIELENKKIVFLENNCKDDKILKSIDNEEIELNLENVNDYDFEGSVIEYIKINDENIKNSYQYLTYYLLELCENTGYYICDFKFINIYNNGTSEYKTYEYRVTYNNKFRIQPLASKKKMFAVLKILDLIYIDFEMKITLSNKQKLFIKRNSELAYLAKKYKVKNIHFFMNKDLNKGQDLFVYPKETTLDTVIKNLVDNNLNIAIKNGKGRWYIKNKEFNTALEGLNSLEKYNASRCKCYLIEY
jgi:hypothetical protein